MPTLVSHLQPSSRDENGLIQVLKVQASQESLFGQSLNKRTQRRGTSGQATISKRTRRIPRNCRNQMLQLHHAALRIPHRFPPTFRIDDCNVPLGFLGYRMNRTHSIMSIATTASPVSGADARDRKQAIFYTKKIH